MSFPDPASLLRHRPPAVLVGEAVAFTGDRLVCASNRRGPWHWSQLLEGAAQTAGLLVGAQRDGLTDRAVIADYREVRLVAPDHEGDVRFTATIDRHVLQFWRCRIEVHADDGTLLLAGTVTLAPAEPAT